MTSTATKVNIYKDSEPDNRYLTVLQLFSALAEIMDKDPTAAHWPIHIEDVARIENECTEGYDWDGLVTHATDGDRTTEEGAQFKVVFLKADPNA